MASKKKSPVVSPPPVPESASPPAQARVESALAVLTRFDRFMWDIAGIFVLAFSMMTLLALPGIPALAGGRLLAGWAVFLRRWLGYGSIFIVVVGAVAGLILLSRRGEGFQRIRWDRVFALEAAAFTALMLFTLSGGATLARAEAGLDGGQVGWGLVELADFVLSPLGFPIAWMSFVLTPLCLLFTLYGLGLARPLTSWLARMAQPERAGNLLSAEPAVMVAPIGDVEARLSPADEQPRKRTALPAEFRKKFRVQAQEESNVPPPPRDDRLPPLSMLVNETSSRPDERNINLTAGLIEKTLAEFGIPAKVIGFKVGPTVTQFAVEPGFVQKPGTDEAEVNRQKVRVSQISSLSRDLTLALSAERLRIEAPVPGRPYIGVEVPNVRSSIVRLRPILENEAFYRVGSPLSLALGRDVSGQPLIADLIQMPHLLIAGTTGSGKSVCIAALTTCLVMNNSPDELRLVMIDPKMVELVRFNGLPHLYGRVETNLERILGVLRWTVAEMDRRYKLLEAMNARHIDSYNRKVRRRKGGEPLPRIVVMVDELADLMMSAPEQTEPVLVRLAQLARATGIHLVVATQRPSTDVVTGLIKANFPARLSFAVASSIDSRVILDTVGAESLLGHGDMLFLPPDAPAPIRCQGVMVSDSEVEKVITFWQGQQAEQAADAPWEEMLKAEEVLADKDNLVEKAIAIVRQEQRASASMLQRRLRIGYPRAARLIDELEELGIISPGTSGREREVLVGRDDEYDDLDQGG